MDIDGPDTAGGRLAIVAYSDYVCPWCYIGLERIERLQREFPVDVTWRPFELHPETPRTGAQFQGLLGGRERARAYRENIQMLAQESGITLRQPAVIANSHLALEAAEFARETGRFETYHRTLFRAYFEEGLDIGDAEVLCDLARRCGLSDQHLRHALGYGTYAEAVDRATAEARAGEVHGAPTYIFSGGFRLAGAQDYQVFASVTRRLIARRADTPS